MCALLCKREKKKKEEGEKARKGGPSDAWGPYCKINRLQREKEEERQRENTTKKKKKTLAGE